MIRVSSDYPEQAWNWMIFLLFVFIAFARGASHSRRRIWCWAGSFLRFTPRWSHSHRGARVLAFTFAKSWLWSCSGHVFPSLSWGRFRECEGNFLGRTCCASQKHGTCRVREDYPWVVHLSDEFQDFNPFFHIWALDLGETIWLGDFHTRLWGKGFLLIFYIIPRIYMDY